MSSYHNNKVKINLNNIQKKYDDITVLNDISINVYEGEFVSILGPSGCGKSTIFNIIANLTNYSSGEINIDGNLSYMYQKDLLLPYKNIIDNVTLPLILNKEKKSNAYKKVKKYNTFFEKNTYKIIKKCV